MQIMGKEFRTIDNGLDPDEVIEFLSTAVGSSEESFKRLEQFSALQAAAKAMDESISNARQIAEAAKRQAETEAHQEREMTLRVAKEQAQEMVDQAKNNCATLIDDVRTVLTDAISRAFEIAKETVSINLEDLDNAIQRVGTSQHNQILINREQVSEEPPTPPTDSAESVDVEESTDSEESNDSSGAEEEEPEGEPDPDLVSLERSLADLENSLTSLHKGTVEDDAEPQSLEEPEQSAEKSEEQPEAKADDGESDDDKSGDDDKQYSGEVMVAIPGGANDLWMQELRKRMFNLPGTRIKAESGMDDNTIILTLSLEKPTALRSVLQGMPNVVKVVEEQANGGSSDKKPMKFLHKTPKKPKHPTFVVEIDRTSDVPVLL